MYIYIYIYIHIISLSPSLYIYIYIYIYMCLSMYTGVQHARHAYSIPSAKVRAAAAASTIYICT